MKIVLFSTNCPKCKVLKQKLQAKNIGYEEVNDIKIMKEKGYDLLPVLQVDGNDMTFKEASDWINLQEDSR